MSDSNAVATLHGVCERVRRARPVRLLGRVRRTVGNLIEADGPPVPPGTLCRVHAEPEALLCESRGFADGATLLFPFRHLAGITPGALVEASPEPMAVGVGPELVGRVLDGLGNPIDGKGPVACRHLARLQNDAPLALERTRITKALETRIRVIDGLLTCGHGQRVGLFAGSGVGKSVLLGMIARHGRADVNVVALIGERGREVKEFIERDLGPEGMQRSVVVAVTSDQSAMMRLKGAEFATAVAEYFRDQGKNVVLLFDSVTRVAMALREVGLATGEPPTTKGYTPSMYSYLPRLLERAGTNARGSITGFYTVLVEGDDLTDPVADTVRATLDGHIVLSRALAGKNLFPAVDVLNSISRVMPDVISPDHRDRATRLRELLAAYRENEDLINIGAYVKGSAPLVDKAIARKEDMDSFLRQWIEEGNDWPQTLERLKLLTAN
jgi:FliI/YscN family ATPase